MAELAVLDKAKVLPSGYTELEYIQSNDNHPRIEVNSIKNIAENEIEFQTQIMWVGSSVNNTATLNIGFGNADTNTTRTFGVTYDGYWKTANNKITPNKQASKNILYDISYKMYSNKVILEVKNGDTTEVNSTVYYSIPFDGNSIFYPTDYIGYGLRSARIYFSKVYRDGVLVFNGIPAKRNSDNAVGLYDTISNTFYKQIASQSSSGYNFIAGPEILPEYSSVIPVVLVGTDTGHSNKKYDLYDRVYDDTGKDIGMVVGFQKDSIDNTNEYAVVCLNAEYRAHEKVFCWKSKFSPADSGVKNLTGFPYYSSFEQFWNNPVDATVLNNKFKTSVTSVYSEPVSTTSTALNHCINTLSPFVIDSINYTPLIPNCVELVDIIKHKEAINKADPTISTYPSLKLLSGRELKTYGTTIGNSEYGYWTTVACVRYADSGDNWPACGVFTLRNSGYFWTDRWTFVNYLAPILEIPNYEVYPVVRRWNLLDRVTDDSGNEIGTVTSFFKADNGIEYTVVCLDAKDRALDLKLFSDATTQIQGTKIYQITDTYSPFELKESATKINNAILSTATSTSKTSDAVNHCRSKSYTINGQVYYGQVPNVRELAEIYMVRSIVNNQDPTTSSYSSYVLSGHNGCLSCTQAKSGNDYKSYVLGTASNIMLSNNNITTPEKNKIIAPILEIPNI